MATSHSSSAPAESPSVHARNLVARARREGAARAIAAAAARERVRTAVAGAGPGLGVTRAILFGSLAWGEFDPARSDVDLLVWGLPAGRAVEAACAIWDLVARPVHVVRAETAPAGLRERAERDGIEIHVA